MDYKQAKAIGEEFIEEIMQFCERCELTGGIRRKKEYPHDVDILIIPKGPELFNFAHKLNSLGGGGKIKQRMIIPYKGIKIELWLSTHSRWVVDFFVSTGSEKHNRMIAGKLKAYKYHLSVSDGVILDEQKIPVAIASEEDIFKLVDMEYVEPYYRTMDKILQAAPRNTDEEEEEPFI